MGVAGNVLAPEALDSLAVQTRMLAAAPEFHLLGNHLLANAKALLFAGCFFDGSEAAAWLRQGLSIYDRELPEQILTDGGHFELSPMYHAIILNDLLDVTNVGIAYGAELPELTAWTDGLRKTIERMRAWLTAMTHPDGLIAFFNDATFDQAPGRDMLEAYAARLDLGQSPALNDGTTVLETSGYVRYSHEGTALIADIGRIGPDYLPGHAHADTLSFELSVQGRRALVNSGVSRYGDDTERLRQRGTAAHNTVTIDQADSSEIWSGFRVARRARPHDLRVDAHGDAVTLSCAHDGYRRLPGHVTHERIWTIAPVAWRSKIA
ncbi:MAG: alginate lyase family protein [Pirellulales bacterium]